MNHKNCLRLSAQFVLAVHIAHLDYYWWPSIMLLDFFYQYLFNDTNDVIIRVSICIQYLFIFFTFISLLYSQITKREGREKKTNKKKTLKTHQSTDADTTSIIKKTSRQDESDSIKEDHQLWLEWVTWIAENTSEFYHF